MSYNIDVPNESNVVKNDLVAMESNFNNINQFLSFDHTPITTEIEGKHQKLTLPPFLNPIAILPEGKDLVLYNDNDFNIRGFKLDLLGNRVDFIIPTKFSSNFIIEADGTLELNTNIAVNKLDFNILSSEPVFLGKPSLFYYNNDFYKQDANGTKKITPDFNINQFVTDSTNIVSLLPDQEFSTINVLNYSHLGSINNPSTDYPSARIGSLSYNPNDSTYYYKKGASGDWEKLINTSSGTGILTLNNVAPTTAGNVDLLKSDGITISPNSSANNIALGLQINSDADNAITLDANGLFVSASKVGGGVKEIILPGGSILPNSNGQVQFSSSDNNITFKASSSNVLDYTLNFNSLLPNIIDAQLGLFITPQSKIGIDLSTEPNNGLSFKNGKLFAQTSGGTGSDPKAVYSLNNVLPNATQNISITSPNATLSITPDLTNNSLGLDVVNQKSGILSINSQVPNATGDLKIISSDSSITTDISTVNSLNLKVDPSVLIDTTKALGIDSTSNKIAVKVGTQVDNKLTIDSTGSLYVQQISDDDIRTINNVKADPNNNYNLTLSATDPTTALSIVNSPTTNDVAVKFDLPQVVSTEPNNSIIVDSTGKLFSTGGGGGTSSLEALADDTGAILTGKGASKSIKFISSDSSVSILDASQGNLSQLDFKAQTPSADDYSFEDAIYISDVGDDTSGDGSYSSPYRNLSKAYTELDGSLSKSRILVKNNDKFTNIESQIVLTSNTRDKFTIDINQSSLNKPVVITANSPSKEIIIDIYIDILDIGFDILVQTPANCTTSSLIININANSIILDSNERSGINVATQTQSQNPYNQVLVNMLITQWDESKVNISDKIYEFINYNNALSSVIVKLEVANSISTSTILQNKVDFGLNPNSNTESISFFTTKSTDLVQDSIYDLRNIPVIAPQQITVFILNPLGALKIPVTDLGDTFNNTIYIDNNRIKWKVNDSENIIVDDKNLGTIISTDTPNALALGSDGLLLSTGGGTANPITINNIPSVNDNFTFNSPNATIAYSTSAGTISSDVNISSLISTELNNELILGTDSKLYVKTGALSGVFKSINTISPDASGNFTITSASPILKFNAGTNGINQSFITSNLIDSSDPNNKLKVVNNQLDLPQNSFIASLNGVVSTKSTTGDLIIEPNDGITIGVDNTLKASLGLNLDSTSLESTGTPTTLGVKVSNDSDNILTKTSTGLKVSASSGSAFIKTINKNTPDADGDYQISNGNPTITIDNSSPNTTLLSVNIPDIISKDTNNTIKVGSDNLLLSDAGSSSSGINTINSIQPDSAKNINLTSTAKTLNITATSPNINLDVAIPNLISANTSNEILLGTDNLLYVNVDKNYLKEFQGITASESNIITLKSSDSCLNFTKNTTTLGQVDTSLVLNTTTGSKAFNKVGGLGINISNAIGNSLKLNADGLYADTGSGGGSFPEAQGVVYLDLLRGDDTNSGIQLNKPVKTINKAISVAQEQLSKHSLVIIRGVSYNGTMQLIGNISIPDSRIQLDFNNITLKNTAIIINSITSDMNYVFSDCVNTNIVLGNATAKHRLFFLFRSIDNSTSTSDDPIFYKPANSSNIACNININIADLSIANLTTQIAELPTDTSFINIDIMNSTYNSDVQFSISSKSSYYIKAGESDTI